MDGVKIMRPSLDDIDKNTVLRGVLVPSRRDHKLRFMLTRSVFQPGPGTVPAWGVIANASYRTPRDGRCVIVAADTALSLAALVLVAIAALSLL
jgi:hypothetical protein